MGTPNGFDVSAQVSAIAYVNCYIAILSSLDRDEAGEISEMNLFVTDTLDPRNGQYLKQILPLITEPDYKSYLEQRIHVSAELKRGGIFNLVIGNPPYRNNSTRTLAQVAEVFPSLLESSLANAGAQQRNIRDDYAWFFSAADYYIGDAGLIAFVVSDSFAQNLSYRFFREDVLKSYHVRLLVRLGEHVFQDVGPRISFAIVVLEKRDKVLTNLSSCDSVPYADLRSLVSDTAINELGTDADPRFELHRSTARGTKSLSVSVHTPSAEFNFSLYPAHSVLSRVDDECFPVFAKSSDRLFVDKWPGLITAFDSLYKSKSKTELMHRIESLFEISAKRGSERQILKAVTDWGAQNGFEEKDFERLEGIARQIRQTRIKFSSSKIKRTLDGAIPNSIRWYPPRSNEVYVYYEPSLDIERNENEGKVKGWGSMQQWRDPDSHLIYPKFIYTTASKANYGLKALVVDDGWFVKIHGGTSQQYHYTGLTSPHRAAM